MASRKVQPVAIVGGMSSRTTAPGEAEATFSAAVTGLAPDSDAWARDIAVCRAVAAALLRNAAELEYITGAGAVEGVWDLMGKHIVLPFLPPLINNERFNMNGMVPSAAGMKRLAETFNIVSGRCKKQVFLKGLALHEVPGGGYYINLLWPGYFITGHNTTALRVAIGMALTTPGFSAPPSVQLVVKDVGGSTVLDPAWPFSATKATDDVAPNDIHHVRAITEHALTPNTPYTFYFLCTNGSRPVFASLTECSKEHADDSVEAVCNPTAFVGEAPVYQSHLADLVEANNQLWKHNGAHLISWCANGDASSWPALAATSYTNVIDAAATSPSTAISAGTPGWRLHTLYHNTVNRTTVPVRLAVKVERVSGVGTFDGQLTDGLGNTLGFTGASGAGAQWVVTDGQIPAADAQKWDFHGKVSSGSWRVQAISLMEYEA